MRAARAAGHGHAVAYSQVIIGVAKGGRTAGSTRAAVAAVMASAGHARELAQKIKANGLSTLVLQAPDALETIASHEDVDAVMGEGGHQGGAGALKNGGSHKNSLLSSGG